MIRHPQAISDGVLLLRIKDEVNLKDRMYAIVEPETFQQIIEPHIPDELTGKVHYLSNDCKDIREWLEKVYEEVKKLQEKQVCRDNL